mmetsp:Transcript_13033/g.25320  ORF Transcript_13033/g.25320 Transcript_13033/m.25320 type:complete len:101 (-) Transcript_13033:663-965(-)
MYGRMRDVSFLKHELDYSQSSGQRPHTYPAPASSKVARLFARAREMKQRNDRLVASLLASDGKLALGGLATPRRPVKAKLSSPHLTEPPTPPESISSLRA